MYSKKEYKDEISYAPILIGVYTRLDHFKKCIDKLKKCSEAQSSIVYIASDHSKSADDSLKVDEVRKFIKTIDGFKLVIPILRDINYGTNKNYNDAMEMIFEKYDRLIVMEDDVLVGKGFLSFMNYGLNEYKNDMNIVGVSAYLPPGISNPTGKPFFLKMIHSYGLGFWRDRFFSLKKYRNIAYVDGLFKNFVFYKEYEKNSPHVARALPLIINGEQSFGDIEIELLMHEKNYLMLYPPVSISMNIGNDGSGVHSGFDEKLQIQVISNENYSGSREEIVINQKIQKNIALRRRRFPSFFVNYLIFFCHKYIPGYFVLYIYLRNLIKSLRFLYNFMMIKIRL